MPLIEMIHNKDSWRTLVNMGMNIRSGFFFGTKKYRYAACMRTNNNTLIPALWGRTKKVKLKADRSK
jgi:hypothetical protein